MMEGVQGDFIKLRGQQAERIRTACAGSEDAQLF
jgi:hypothetical protein